MNYINSAQDHESPHKYHGIYLESFRMENKSILGRKQAISEYTSGTQLLSGNSRNHCVSAFTAAQHSLFHMSL